MEMIEFYQKVADSISGTDQLMIITIVAAEDQLQKYCGEKILLAADREPIYSRNKMKEIYKLLQQSAILQEGLQLKKPQLKKLITDNGLTIEVFFEPLLERPRLIIFGAGHVAFSLARVASIIDFEVVVIDDREEMVNSKRFPMADNLHCGEFNQVLEQMQLKPTDYLVIVTRGHQSDYHVLKRVIEKPVRYIGMIGSRRKNRILFEQLVSEGITPALIKKVHAPIGLDLGSETPEEIAVSIAAELIEVRRNKHG